jgi:predicted metal-dependent phosphoesterase TrpH
MIDLHVHTNFSDGTLSPEKVVQRAKFRGLTAIAITDHDTLAGIAEAMTEGKNAGIEIVPGVEISALEEHGNLHILGYFIDPEDKELGNALEFLRNGRKERIPRMLRKLAAHDMPITLEEIEREAPGGVPGRPHVANVMIYHGYVRSIPEAFEKYLRKGAPAYEDKVKLPPDQAIAAIRKAGGIPVLAHPFSLEEGNADKLLTRVEMLKHLGLMGIEAYYPSHTKEQTRTYMEIAEKLDLCVTGGTDFHGANKPDTELGRISNGGPLPYALLEGLKNRLKAVSRS